jgi:hypothetical protein
MPHLTLKSAVADVNVVHLVYEANRLREQGLDGFAASLEVVAITGIVSADDAAAHDSICVSISPGCYRTPGCRYCATGMVSEQKGVTGLSLTVDELAEQVVGALHQARARRPSFGRGSLSLSFMGKGEPGLYPELVMGTLARLAGDGTITRSSIATTGLPRYFQRLSQAYSDCGAHFPAPLLQLSIHAAFDAHRVELVTNPQALAPIEGVLTSAIEDYALRVLPRGTFITIRLNVMKWGDSKSNFDEASLDELARLVRTHSERYQDHGFGGITVVVARLNETAAIGGQGIRSGSDQELHRTVASLHARGIAAREFTGGRVTTRLGGCGTLSCDASSGPPQG